MMNGQTIRFLNGLETRLNEGDDVLLSAARSRGIG
jgi:molybdopterin converting factor small subunit